MTQASTQSGNGGAGNGGAKQQQLLESSTPNTVETPLGTLRFENGVPDEETATKLYEQLDRTHAIDAFLNAFSGVNMWALYKGVVNAGVKENEVLLFSGLMDSSSLFLTANADTVYFFTFIDLSQGPMLVESPPVSLDLIDDMWWRWVTDMGLPGPDRGAGGRYLLVPPGYDGPLPKGGVFVCHSRTTRVALLGRAFLENDDPKPTVERIKNTLRIYPYQQGMFGTSIGDILAGEPGPKPPWDEKTWAAALIPPAPPKFIEGTGKVMNTLPPNDFSFFEMLDALIQDQPASALDPEIVAHCAAVGIVKGKPFKPDARMKKILTEAAAIGNAAARAVTVRPRHSEAFHFYGETSSWMNPLFAGGYEFLTPPAMISNGVQPVASDGARKLHARTAFFYMATGISPAMCMRLTHLGSQYLMNFLDAKGRGFDGAQSYSMTLPPGIPAERFWSMTVYDNQTRSMLQTPQRFPRAGSQSFPSPAAAKNPDGSTTVHFGPTLPSGVAKGNWIQTVAGKGWFAILRLYSPTATFFDKTWRPSEIEQVQARTTEKAAKPTQPASRP